MTALRVALLSPVFWPEVRRGSERFARELADGLITRGHEPTLITSHRGATTVCMEDGLRVIRLWRPPDARLERRMFERHLTPQDIHDRYRVLNGAIYGLASHGRFFGAFKPGNRSRDVPGLYLAGGAAHPGPGMPMVLMSGWIAADALDSDLSGNARISA